ncbi:MAG: hypothetical protein JNN12_02755 [Bacteroidetes Order II. Incertae sedis bacterium]|nr:hypothetical protein [Bacteroidetes Order II. bacterium]
MSIRINDLQQYVAQDAVEFAQYTDVSSDDLRDQFIEILRQKVHGFCFSLYEEGQKPGDVVTEAQIRRRLNVLKPHCSWIRTFSCTEGNELIPKLAKELGFKTLVGAWIGKDAEKNQAEVEALIVLAEEGLVDIAAVGNEVLYRNELSAEALCVQIEQVKRAIPYIPVGYVDAYYQFVQHRNIADSCDLILCNCYPYWEGTSIEDSLSHIHQMYQQALSVSSGKKVIITETGWPSQGLNFKAAYPSIENTKRYFVQFQQWAKALNIDSFYFSSFDESWKIGDEGDVGAYWGLWDCAEQLKV